MNRSVVTFGIMAMIAPVASGAVVHLPTGVTVSLTGTTGITQDASFNATLSGFSSPITSGVTTDTTAATYTDTTHSRFLGFDQAGNNEALASVTYTFTAPLNNLGGFLFWNYWETAQGGNQAVLNRGIEGATLTITHSGGTSTETFTFSQVALNQSAATAQQKFFANTYNGVTSIKFDNINESQNGPFAGWNGFAAVAVPEPSVLSLVGLAVLPLLRRKRM